MDILGYFLSISLIFFINSWNSYRTILLKCQFSIESDIDKNEFDLYIHRRSSIRYIETNL